LAQWLAGREEYGSISATVIRRGLKPFYAQIKLVVKTKKKKPFIKFSFNTKKKVKNNIH
jgi:hypothetical protein